MKFKLILLVCLAMSSSAARLQAQEARTEGAQKSTVEADADPAAGLKQRLVQLKPRLKELRAKPRALKPGEAVGLNPQPEPPGKARSVKVNNKRDEVSLNPQPEPPAASETCCVRCAFR